MKLVEQVIPASELGVAVILNVSFASSAASGLVLILNVTNFFPAGSTTNLGLCTAKSLPIKLLIGLIQIQVVHGYMHTYTLL